jgi:hypothetical protein
MLSPQQRDAKHQQWRARNDRHQDADEPDEDEHHSHRPARIAPPTGQGGAEG